MYHCYLIIGLISKEMYCGIILQKQYGSFIKYIIFIMILKCCEPCDLKVEKMEIKVSCEYVCIL